MKLVEVHFGIVSAFGIFRNMSHLAHKEETNQTRLYIIGRSFGGAATYSALAGILEERAIQTVDR